MATFVVKCPREESVLQDIQPDELHGKMQDPCFIEAAQLIDVREPDEAHGVIIKRSGNSYRGLVPCSGISFLPPSPMQLIANIVVTSNALVCMKMNAHKEADIIFETKEGQAQASLPGFHVLPLRQFGSWGPEITTKFDPQKDTYVLKN
ncbi:hypothetical protein CsSME_00047789 [Camellia sinensis var. sinensis]